MYKNKDSRNIALEKEGKMSDNGVIKQAVRGLLLQANLCKGFSGPLKGL